MLRTSWGRPATQGPWALKSAVTTANPEVMQAPSRREGRADRFDTHTAVTPQTDCRRRRPAPKTRPHQASVSKTLFATGHGPQQLCAWTADRPQTLLLLPWMWGQPPAQASDAPACASVPDTVSTSVRQDCEHARCGLVSAHSRCHRGDAPTLPPAPGSVARARPPGSAGPPAGLPALPLPSFLTGFQMFCPVCVLKKRVRSLLAGMLTSRCSQPILPTLASYPGSSTL